MNGRNLVLCLDGTSNKFKQDNTNVLKLFAMIDRAREDQLAYYQPGIGTITPIGIYGRVTKWAIRKLDLAFGFLLEQHVSDAYRFLMRYYEPGDRIYIFGFSRGGFTARVLAGMIHKVGLLPRGNEEMVPFAWDFYKRARATRKDFALTADFKRIFGAAGRPAPIELLGLWDTVSSVRYIGGAPRFDNVQTNPSVQHVRHAVALDERRAYFRQNLWKADGKPDDVVEVWFAGVHCDVGGGYLSTECGLSNIALRWMVRAIGGLEFPVYLDRDTMDRFLTANPEGFVVSPDPAAEKHESLRWFWWPVELLPKRSADPTDNFRKKWKIPLGRRRRIPDGARIHESVQSRIDAGLFRRDALPTNVTLTADEAEPKEAVR